MIAVSGDKRVLAVSLKSLESFSVQIYDINSLSHKVTIKMPLNSSGVDIVLMSLSCDGKHLAIQIGAPEWLIFYFATDNGSLLASIQTCSSLEYSINQVSVNPFDDTEIFVCNDTIATIFKLTEDSLVANILECATLNPPLEQKYVQHCWLAAKRIVLGSSIGHLVIIHDDCIIQTEKLSSFGSIQSTKDGFVVGGSGGSISIYQSSADNRYSIAQIIRLPDMTLNVTSISSAPDTDDLLIQVSSGDFYQCVLLPTPSEYSERSQNLIQARVGICNTLLGSSHSGSINGLDTCNRKPLLVTCSTDKTIKIWNYLNRKCELTKSFTDEPLSIALHQSGLYVLVGFNDKLRLMNILINDLQLVHEFAIRACKECRFSNGGHLIAAAHGSVIQLYSSWTFENIGYFKGHNGILKSLFWSSDDRFLISAGSDGAVYTWNIGTMKRESEHILKGCAYSKGVCLPNGKIIFVVGSDRSIKEMKDSVVSNVVESNMVLTQVALSHHGTMIFAGTHSGTIRTFKYPFDQGNVFREYQAHDGSVTQLAISADDQYLFSSSEDGCIYMFKVGSQDIAPLDQMAFASEVSHFKKILIAKSDLEDKSLVTNDLQKQFDELKVEQEYQLRIKDMSTSQKIKDATGNFTTEIVKREQCDQKILNEIDTENRKHDQEYNISLTKYHDETQCITLKNCDFLNRESQKFHLQQKQLAEKDLLRAQKQQDLLKVRIQDLQESRQTAETKYESICNDYRETNNKLQRQKNKFTDMDIQNHYSIDAKIVSAEAQCQKALLIEVQDIAKLDIENGKMGRKFITLKKDINDNRSENSKWKDYSVLLETKITNLASDILNLRKIIKDRDEQIQEKEHKVHDVKKRNQELEKYKFVLDYRIKELKAQVGPRETYASTLNQKLEEIESTIRKTDVRRLRCEKIISTNNVSLDESTRQVVRGHLKIETALCLTKEFKFDLENLINFFQNPDLLKQSSQRLLSKYSTPKEEDILLDNIVITNGVFQKNLKNEIAELKAKLEYRSKDFEEQIIKSTAGNQKLAM